MKLYKKLYITRFKNVENLTLGSFILVDENENFIQSGFTLEPEYPDTIESNQNKRIPKGLYQVDNTIYSPKFKQVLPTLYSMFLSKDRRILIHSGNNRSHTNGCILVGSYLNKEQTEVLNSKAALRLLQDNIQNSTLLLQIF